jgi:uncharacterized protein YjbJ (UPF0337 family)
MQEVVMAERNRDRDDDMMDRGSENRVKGTAKEMEGKIRGKVGDAVDDRSEHLKGRAKEMEGKVQKKFGEAQERLGEDDKDRES